MKEGMLISLPRQTDYGWSTMFYTDRRLVHRFKMIISLVFDKCKRKRANHECATHKTHKCKQSPRIWLEKAMTFFFSLSVVAFYLVVRTTHFIAARWLHFIFFSLALFSSLLVNERLSMPSVEWKLSALSLLLASRLLFYFFFVCFIFFFVLLILRLEFDSGCKCNY